MIIGPGATAELKVSQVRPWSAEARPCSGGFFRIVVVIRHMENTPLRKAQKVVIS